MIVKKVQKQQKEKYEKHSATGDSRSLFERFPFVGKYLSNIPTGNALLNTIVTNVCSITMVLQNTNATGGLNTCGMYMNGISFQSYSDLQSWIASNGSRLVNFLNKQGGVSDTILTVKVTYGTRSPCPGLFISSDLGSSANISPGSLYVTPIVSSIVLNMNGVNVKGATVQYGSGASVALQLAGNNGIVLDNSFITSSGRMRLSVTSSDGTTAVYTQYGNQILPPDAIHDH